MSASERAGSRATFDAHDGEGRSFVFEEPVGAIAAWTLDRVVSALREVEVAVADGAHAAGFIAYEAAPAFDPALAAHPPRPDLPLVWFGLYARRTRSEAPRETAGVQAARVGPWTPAISAAEHALRVGRIRELIAAGDTYQVNLTFTLQAELEGDPEDLYHAVRASQRAGYCAMLRAPFGTVISASPELFFSRTGRDLLLRPMKGTRPRGRWTEEDDALALELLDSPKERAENLMIVDLLRNDAGRVAEIGTVAVPRLFELERYPTVHQLTSTVTARTRPGVGLTELLAALFPSGSVTGAPKIRTMEIIRELEDGPRGVYTGALGFVSADEAVFNVPIRTLLVSPDGRRVEMGVGSGITWDSDPDAELAECMQKAAFVHRRRPEPDLLETLRYDPGQGYHLLEGHLRRLERSARYFGVQLDLHRVRVALEKAVAQASAGREPATARASDAVAGAAISPAPGSSPEAARSLRVRLTVSPNGATRVECQPLLPAPPLLRAALSSEPVDTSSPFIYHKTTERALYSGHLADHPDHDEVLLTNERCELTEFTTGNLVIDLDGRRYTPPVSAGLLPGVAREDLISRGVLSERPLTAADLARAEAVYLINSVRDMIPVQVDP